MATPSVPLMPEAAEPPAKRRRSDNESLAGTCASDFASHSAPASAEQTLEARVREFQHWLEHTPGVNFASDLLKVEPLDGFGVGIISRRAVSAGQSIAHVPFSLCITPELVAADVDFSARVENALNVLAEEQKSETALIHSLGSLFLPMRVRIWLYMIHGRWDTSSRHHHYLRLIPETFEDPMWWSESELAQLQGTSVFAAVRQERALLAHLHAVHVQPLTQGSPKDWPPAIFNEKALLWASSAWKSRAFPRFLAGQRPLHSAAEENGQVTGALLPIIDSINHQSGAMIEYRVGPPGTGVELLTSKDMPGEIAAGQQLWNNYGPRPDEEWLFNYGFLPAEQPASNKIELALAVSGPSSRLRASAKAIRDLDVDAVLGHSGSDDRKTALLRIGPFKICWTHPPSTESVDASNFHADQCEGDGAACVEFPTSMLKAFMIACHSGKCGANESHAAADKQALRSRLVALFETKISDVAAHLLCQSQGPLHQSNPRMVLARRYVMRLRCILQGAVAFLHTLSESDLSNIFTEATDVAGVALQGFDTASLEIRLVFAKEFEDEMEESVVEDQSTNCSSDEAGADSDVESSSGDGEEAHDVQQDDKETEMGEFVLFGDGAAIAVTMPKYLAAAAADLSA